MAYRPRKFSHRPQKTQFKASEYIPIWNQQHTDTTNLMAEMAFERLGITDWFSYFQVLAIPIALCTAFGCLYGGYYWGIKGALIGFIGGLVAPAASVYLLVVVAYAAAIMLAFVAAWAVVLGLAYFVLTH